MGSVDRNVKPELDRMTVGGVTIITDHRLREHAGILVAFSERTGGVSEAPFDSLNLAAHVGDEPHAVDENRARLLRALQIPQTRALLTTAEQVHGERIAEVSAAEAGSGSFADSGKGPVPGTDALITAEQGVPLLLCYADCVPVVIVAWGDRGPGISVAHAGWRGALASLPGKAAVRLMNSVAAGPEDARAYIGPHIGNCCYNVDERRISLFSNRFDTIAAVGDGLDLSAAVKESLSEAGIARQAIVEAELCTSDHTERFYSFRTAQVTGRHGAIAAIA